MTVQEATNKPSSRQRASALAFVCALLGACATQPLPPESAVDGKPAVPAEVSQPEIVVVTPPADITLPEPAPPAEPPTVSVVLTNRSPAFDSVATALNDYFEDMTVYDLDDKSLPPVLAFRLINDSPTDVVVAIGLRAARSSIAMSAVPVVFAQVFNHQDHSLLGEKSRGIAAVAPMESQLAAWKDAEPELASVGLIIGPGHDALLEEAELAAARHGVTLITSIATSDQEALYNFKRMSRNIDGFWLLPDNRILSTRVLTEIVDRAESRGVSVLVPSPGMLSLGATISVSTVANDIAAKIHDVIQAISAGTIDSLQPITPLTEISVEIGPPSGADAKVANNRPKVITR